MKIVNLTPHEINMMTEQGELVIPSSGMARASADKKQIDIIETNGVTFPVNTTKFGEVEGLPDPQEGVMYVVSMLIAQLLPNRDDLLIVDDTVRDDKGRIIGAKAFAKMTATDSPSVTTQLVELLEEAIGNIELLHWTWEETKDGETEEYVRDYIERLKNILNEPSPTK